MFSMMHLELGDYEVKLTKKRIKNIYLRVDLSNGQIKVSAPLKCSLQNIQNFITSKALWIKQQQEKVSWRQTRVPKEYVDNTVLYFAGRPYTLKLIEHNSRPKV